MAADRDPPAEICQEGDWSQRGHEVVTRWSRVGHELVTSWSRSPRFKRPRPARRVIKSQIEDFTELYNSQVPGEEWTPEMILSSYTK